LVGFYADHFKIADGDALVAVTPGHAFAALGAAATTIAGVRADTAGGAVVFLDAVAGGQTGEVVPLHGAGRAAALGGAGHVHCGHAVEHLPGGHDRPDLHL